MNPRFSVVIPTYNRADSVLDTLSSCLAQSCQDLEVIVVDDGSTDNTVAVLEAIDDARVRVVRQENAGPAAARNHGVRLARGEYIAYLDSDDTWYPEFLDSVNATLAQQSDAVVYGQIIVDRGVNRYWVKPERGMQADESIFDYLYVHGGFIQTSTMVVPAALAKAVCWEEAITFGDNDQYAIDLWRAGARFVMLPRPLTLYADIVSEAALSQLPIFGGATAKYTNFFDWMAEQREAMSDAAWAGFQARFVSVSLARKQPIASFRLLWSARRAGVMGVGGVLRQSVQNFTPRSYRKLVDRYVSWRGLPIEQIRG